MIEYSTSPLRSVNKLFVQLSVCDSISFAYFGVVFVTSDRFLIFYLETIFIVFYYDKDVPLVFGCIVTADIVNGIVTV